MGIKMQMKRYISALFRSVRHLKTCKITQIARPPILTTRQRELLEFLAAGATRNEIAQHFGISPETVKIHTRAILEKFDAKTVRDAIEYIVAFLCCAVRFLKSTLQSIIRVRFSTLC